MQSPPSKVSGRYRTPHPVSADMYVGVALQDMANFFGSYHRLPQPEGLDVVMQRITELQLLTMPEHRFGIAGAVHAVMHLHPPMQTGWRLKWPKQMAIMDECRPSEEDSEVTRPPEIDYLWMYGITCWDEYTIDRIIRIGLRGDMAGDAAVRVAAYHALHPLMLQALARAAATTTAALRPDTTIPAASIHSLALLAATEPIFQASVLYIGWRNARAATTAIEAQEAAFVAKTPDGNLPHNFPTCWDGYPVMGAQATAIELINWRRLHAAKERP